MPDNSPLGPDQFAQRISAVGGRVDFVFAEERPFASCHASTLVQADDGCLLCAWFGGTAEKDPDVGIWAARFADGAWSAPFRVAKVGEVAHWNPVLFSDPRHGTFLFFKVGPEVVTWQTYWMRTADSGLTWSQPVELVPGDVGGRGPVKNKAIILADGAWLAPASTEPGSYQPFADRSEDGGSTWQRSADFASDFAPVARNGAIQPTFWESSPANVHALIRTSHGYIARSDSSDSGRNWTKQYDSGLPNNNSGIDALRLEDGRVLLIYNPVAEDWGPRTPLNLAVSADNGDSWTDVASLEADEGEYSYPAIVAVPGGVAVSYTWQRQRIRCWQFPVTAI